MPCLRRIAPSAPRSPLTRQASASRTIRSFSAALNTRRERFATVSSGAADEATGSGRACGGGIANKAVFRDSWGMFVNPFSAHSYIGFEKELSHATLAQGESAPRVFKHRLQPCRHSLDFRPSRTVR